MNNPFLTQPAGNIPNRRIAEALLPQAPKPQVGSGLNAISEALVARGVRPQSRFNDAQAFDVADLDAFKLMQLNPQYGDAVEADVNTTEGKTLSLLRRMMLADAALEDPRLGSALTEWDQNIASKLGSVGRLYTNDEFELGNLMASEFANAVIRNDSGAQAPEPEVKRYMQMYFPQPGEQESQLQAKKTLRREIIRSLQQALGGDAAPAVRQLVEEMQALRQQADVPDGSLTGDAPTATQTTPSQQPDQDGWREVNGVRIRVKQ